MFPPLLGPASPDPALTLADIDKPTSLLLAPDQSELTGAGRTIAHLSAPFRPLPCPHSSLLPILGRLFPWKPSCLLPTFPEGHLSSYTMRRNATAHTLSAVLIGAFQRNP